MRLRKLLLSLFLVLLVQQAASQNYLNLSGKWNVTRSEGNRFWFSDLIDIDPAMYPQRYIPVDVPMDLNLAMQKRGMFSDFNFGINSLAPRWISQQHWQYYRYFDVPEEAENKPTWLVFDQLDYSATILLNGEIVGTHKNAFTPCRINVTGKLREGPNLLVVCVESGVFYIEEKSSHGHGLNKRQWLRKPEYQYEWDSTPQLINVGITGDVRMEWRETARLDQIVMNVKMNDDLSSAELTIRPFIERLADKSNFTVEATLVETDQKVSVRDTLSKTLRPVELKMKVDKPKLWWPNGYGAQSLYTVKIEIKENGKLIDSGSRRIGFRKMEVDKSVHPVAGNYFTMKINNEKIFIKGGNWVPADMIFSSVTRDRLEKAIGLAAGANFNFFRIWGGGEYVGNDFLDLCDEKGLLVWHDFPFACNIYPGTDTEFLNSVRAEATWAVREFSHHPSLIVWCGNNEIEQLGWGNQSDYMIYHDLLPKIIKRELPQMFYWPSSPFSENYENPTSAITGNQHPWGVGLGSADFYRYRTRVDRFPTEGGFLGASSPATLRQFLPKDEQYVNSMSWIHHDNFYYRDEIIPYWFGKTHEQMTFDEYAFGSALLQAEALSEYIANYHRRKFSSSSAIFWMFKDGWPASHGWAIVDYYNRKKLAYHPVRRGFESISVVVADDGEKINVYGINDAMAEWEGKLQYGVFGTGGGYVINEESNVKLSANASTIIGSFEKSVFENAGYNNHSAFAVLRNNNDIPVSQHKMMMARFKDMNLEKPKISIEQKGDYAIFSSPVFIWGVCLDIDGESHVNDNCFDLFPGIPYYVKLNKGEKLSVRKTGNDLLLSLNRIQ